MYGWLGKIFNIEHAPLMTQALNIFPIIKETKINVTELTVKPDHFHKTRQIYNTLITNLSMSAVKEIKANPHNRTIGTHNFMVSAQRDHRLQYSIRVIAIVRKHICHLCNDKIDSFNITKAVVKK